jgi:hypothetical protein
MLPLSQKINANIVGGPTGGINTVGSTLRYDDMNATNGGVARNTTVNNTTYTTVYNYTGSGIIFNWVLNLENANNWRIKFIVDGVNIFPSPFLSTADMASDIAYDLEYDSDSISPLLVGLSHEEIERITWSCPSGFPVRFNSSVQIQVIRITTTGRFRAGLITLTKDT